MRARTGERGFEFFRRRASSALERRFTPSLDLLQTISNRLVIAQRARGRSQVRSLLRTRLLFWSSLASVQCIGGREASERKREKKNWGAPDRQQNIFLLSPDRFSGASTRTTSASASRCDHVPLGAKTSAAKILFGPPPPGRACYQTARHESAAKSIVGRALVPYFESFGRWSRA